MDSSEHRGDPFSSSDEAFFHAGVRSEQEPLSERPVTLDDDEILADTASSLSARAARRGRLQRAVTSTVAALGVLALVGLGRYALRPGVSASAPSTGGAVSATLPSAASVTTASDETVPAELLASLGAADDDSVWLTPSICEMPGTARLIGPEPPPDDDSAREATSVVEPLDQGTHRTAGPPAAKHAGAKQSTQAPARHATQVHRRVKVAPVSKSALLRAIRAS